METIDKSPSAEDSGPRARRAGVDDAPALALVGAATFLESYAHLLPAADIIAHAASQHAAGVYAGWLQDPRCACWLATHEPGGAPVGYLVATPPDLPLEGIDGTDWEIRRIYVLHRFHGAGLGRGLMAEATAEARRAGKRRLLLGVYSRNEPALRFYARLGFEPVGTRAFRVGNNDYHDFILAKATG